MSTLDATGELAGRTLRKVRRRLLPFMVLLYFVAYLDRGNVSFAELQMGKDLRLSGAAFGFGAGIFFVGYFLFEIPSNLALHRFGARRWIARIVVSWGIVASAMLFAHGPVSFSVLRFLLGVAEAGFFPGMILYLSRWFPAASRVSMLGLFILAQPLSNALGAPLSGLLLNLDGQFGLAGWQWLFLCEGVPAIVLGLITPLLLPSHPDDARWLAADEHAWLTRTLAAEERSKVSAHGWRGGLTDPLVIKLTVVYFGIVFGTYGLSMWLPTVVKSLGRFSSVQIGAIVLVPYALAAIGVVLWSRNSDRTGERHRHTAIAVALGAIGLVVSVYGQQVSPLLAMAGISLAAIGLYSALSPFWELPSAALAGAAAATGIALINSVGNLAGFLAPYLVGVLKDQTGSTRPGLLMLAAVLLAAAVLVWVIGRRPGRRVGPAGEPVAGVARSAD